MNNSIAALLESGGFSEEARNEIEAVWNSKLNEAREDITQELRGEFANRFEHDRERMVSALDKMVEETLKAEVAKIAEEQKAAAEARVAAIKEMKSKAAMLDTFVSTQLAKEIREFREDNAKRNAGVDKLDEFVKAQLETEVKEFAEDKQDLANTKVRLIKESKAEFAKLKRQFVERTSEALAETVNTQLTKEITQLKEDITLARENNFGRKIFEAFVGEFSTSHLNENEEVRKLQKDLVAMGEKLSEATKLIDQKTQQLDEAKAENQKIVESAERKEMLNKLLKPLNREKADVMKELLESVQTPNLEKAFTKYLPAVEGGSKKRKVINETATKRSASTGNRKTKVVENSSNDTDELKLLAGLK